MKGTAIFLFLLALLTVHLKASARQRNADNDDDIDVLIKRLENTLDAQIREHITLTDGEVDNRGTARRKKLRQKFWNPYSGTRNKDDPTPKPSG